MSFLKVFNDADATQPVFSATEGDVIARELGAHGIRFERWPLKALSESADQAEILAAYSEEVERLRREEGFQSADVIHMTPDHPDKDALRTKFLDEHRHDEDEVRFFVRGEGVFYLHLDNRVYAIGCAQGDLMSVPTGTPHWFDMGPAPAFSCIRLFTRTEGWIAHMTGSPIAERFPRFEGLEAS
ncbi:1,2-dihydroxy-3-keto-5-methylthiopentene dioxygenase [Larsenimonas salina]|uniref:1,2-dihydroxy-3-keto-5-methylthiopentene dioxygenase n=1 Tax=Larsenimonas salina TaxID=1295565 RepID=UPI0020747CAA|nr:cupin [Larsenimonas salina]MCM5703965.1 cupin [Larsenimonas salina]